MKDEKDYYLTTAITYTSGKPHIGNTYEIILADAIARFKRQEGYNVRFQTGTDEHGQKIEIKAKEAGIEPKQYVDQVAGVVKNIWDMMDTSYDRFMRTTDEYHEKQVQKIFKKLYDKGDIYLGHYEGKYCTACESFFTESQLVDGKCPDCGGDVHDAKEEAYFFKLSKYQDRLIKHIEDHPEFIQPVSRKNEMMNNFLKPGLQDLCVSRTSFKWSIPVDFDPKHVVYVWIDALTNYITGLGYDADGNHGELYKKYWPADLHLVGKEIVRFHTIIWPMMLMSLELPLPKKVFGHGWMIVDGTKMSKSLGNVIDPIPLIDTYGADSLRYYLLSEITLGNDGNFTLPNFVTKINADLSNDLGNLLNRTIAMIEKYHGGVITKCDDMDDLDRDVSTLAVQTAKDFEAAMENMELNKAIKSVWAFIGRMNKYIDETMPWVLAKSEDAHDKARLQSAMYHLAEALRIIAILVSPVIPVGAPKIWDQLGLTGFGSATIEDAKVWGLIPTGTKVVKGDPIYPRFEIPEMIEVVAKEEVENSVDTSNIPPLKENITYDDFEKLDLRVAKVVSCEKVPKSKKLLKFVLDIGIEERTVLSGISQYYEPEAMVGKKVIYLSNLAPKKMMGIESYGMILSASDWEEHLEVTNIESLPAGSVVK